MIELKYIGRSEDTSLQHYDLVLDDFVIELVVHNDVDLLQQVKHHISRSKERDGERRRRR